MLTLIVFFPPHDACVWQCNPRWGSLAENHSPESKGFRRMTKGEEPIQLYINIYIWYLVPHVFSFCHIFILYLRVLGFLPGNMVIIKNHCIVVTQVFRLSRTTSPTCCSHVFDPDDDDDDDDDDDARWKITNISRITNMKEDFEQDAWELLKDFGCRFKWGWSQKLSALPGGGGRRLWSENLRAMGQDFSLCILCQTNLEQPWWFDKIFVPPHKIE